MFSRIAGRYHLLNRLMTLGLDSRWRRKAVQRLAPRSAGRYLDLGSGMGDLAFAVRKASPGSRVMALDFSHEMIRKGIAHAGGEQVGWVLADASNLPFADQSFDGAISGFLLRNVADVTRVLLEQYRVLARGGRLVCLETSPPKPGPLKWPVEFHLRVVIPLLGLLFAGNRGDYRYLSDSTESFFRPEALADALRAAGFEQVEFSYCIPGGAAIHCGMRPHQGG